MIGAGSRTRKTALSADCPLIPMALGRQLSMGRMTGIELNRPPPVCEMTASPIDLQQEIGDFDVRQQTVGLRSQELCFGSRVVLERGDLQAFLVDAGIRQFVSTGC
jgi:hypothetical protein